ncbi:restriction endonuclease subunit S [Alteromonas sp.]|uniref:restriction endonuclease subunit S n=1 Tax=Alteromonas sp. TaxID=232 RepID=UPI000B6678AA|nr:restriction endonuclease subunit S [Alteromonas sp.]MAI37679.1 restriction endonuclease subunit S [Alteromonas sp.]OUX87847.1 MAG: hypothetical protein CBB95_08815 [Alteromonas sp. TMED35]|tara:strand:+ start:34331 stop:35539 length:1209 start_codon:yes stop_codon:yes gene_type:complete
MKLVRLKDCCTIKPPKSEAKKLLGASDLISFVPMSNLGIDTPDILLEENKQLSQVANSYTYFAENDVLLAKITPCFENGKLGIAKGLTNGVGFGSSEFIVFRTNEELLPEYLYYFLLRPTFRERGQKLMTGAVGHKRIPKEFIENIEVPLPTVDEQRRIVAILKQSLADILRAKLSAKRNLKNTQELFNSYLHQIFTEIKKGNIQVNLGEIAEVSSGGTPKKTNKEFWQGDIPWYSSGELNKTFTIDPKEKITEAGLAGSNAKLFPKGSLLIGMYDTAALKMSILDREGTFNQAICGVKPNGKINLEFVLHSINFIKPDLLKLRRGVRQKNLNQSKIKDIPLFFPNLEKQDEVVAELRNLESQLNDLAEIYQRKIVALDDLKKSILEKAFSGGLTNSKGAAA